MGGSPPYKKIIIIVLSTLVVYFTLIGPLFNKDVTFDITSLEEDYIIIVGYVVSKRFGGIWISDKPISMDERLTGYITSNYGAGSIYVTKHKRVENQPLFKDLKINHKVRVYSDILRESNPPKTSAYYVEILENEEMDD